MENRTCGNCKHYDKTVTCNDYARCDCKKQVYGFVAPEQQICKYFVPKRKPTLFDDITESMETLAESIVFCFDKGDEVYWASPLVDGDYKTRQKALDATIEELKKKERG